MRPVEQRSTSSGTQPSSFAAQLTAKELGCVPDDVLVCSTGLIGIPLDLAPVRRGHPCPRASAHGATSEQVRRAARAIMTTDTVPKEVVVAGDGWTIGGMAKGAAMLAPNMATMLAVLTTDAAVDARRVAAQLSDAVAQVVQPHRRRRLHEHQRHRRWSSPTASPGHPTTRAFRVRASTEACQSLAMQMVRDAEGHTKVVTVASTRLPPSMRPSARPASSPAACS